MRPVPVCALLLAACGAESAPADAGPVWNLAPAFTVGSLDGPDAFGRVQSIVADAAGRLYVADALAHQILLFDSTGRAAGAIGREGSGPGEFAGLQSLAWLGDTLVVMDWRNARIGLFDITGAWLGQFLHQPMSGPALAVRFHRASPAAIWAFQIDRNRRPLERIYVRFTSSGPRDSLRPPRARWAEGATVTCEVSGGIRFFTTPFAPHELLTFTPRGHVLRAWTGGYALAEVSADGDTIELIRRSLAPRPIGDQAWDSATAEWRAFREEAPGAACEGALERPAHQPVLRFAMYDPDGRLWVEYRDAEGWAWDVWEGDALLGSFAGPERDARIEPYARGDRFYVVTRDGLGVQRVVAYRVSPAPPPAWR